MKSSIDILCFKAKKKRGEYSDSISSDRRLHDRRLQQDRRDISILRGQARHDRRRNDRRDLIILRQQSPYFLRTELVNARLTQSSSSVQCSNDLLRMWIITEEAHLTGLFSDYGEKLPYIRINRYNAKGFETAQAKLGENHPDVILVDMRLSLDNVVEQLRMIRGKMPSVKIILLYDRDLPDFINEIIEYRISGFLPVEVDQKIFEKAIRVVVRREELWFPNYLIRQVFDVLSKWQNSSCAFPPRDIVLTKSEQEIIKFVAKGLTNKQIAQQLSVSPETVKKHLKSVFIKTGVCNRSQLVSGYLSRIGISK